MEKTRSFAIVATTYEPDGSKRSVVEAMCSELADAKSICKINNENYRKKREENKLLPKVVWTYTEV